MTHPSFIHTQRSESLDAFEESLRSLAVNDRHFEALRRAGTASAASMAAKRPVTSDHIGNAAYSAAAFAVLAEVILAQERRIAQLEEVLASKAKK